MPNLLLSADRHSALQPWTLGSSNPLSSAGTTGMQLHAQQLLTSLIFSFNNWETAEQNITWWFFWSIQEKKNFIVILSCARVQIKYKESFLLYSFIYKIKTLHITSKWNECLPGYMKNNNISFRERKEFNGDCSQQCAPETHCPTAFQLTALRTSSLCPSTPPNIATRVSVWIFHNRKAWSSIEIK